MKLVPFLGLCLGLVLAGCSSDSEEEGGSGGGSSTGGSGGGDGGDGCGNFCTASTCCDCSETQCTTPYNACRCEPDCVALIECIRACAPSDIPCQDGCYSGHPAGYQPYVALEGCAVTFCTSECQPPNDAGAD